MLRNETYEIDGQKFHLRDPNDLDLLEDEKVRAFFKNFYAPDKQTISGSISSGELSGLLETVLVPEGELPPDFNYKKVKRGTATQIIADFFLNSVFSTLDIANSLKSSMKEQIEP